VEDLKEVKKQEEINVQRHNSGVDGGEDDEKQTDLSNNVAKKQHGRRDGALVRSINTVQRTQDQRDDCKK